MVNLVLVAQERVLITEAALIKNRMNAYFFFGNEQQEILHDIV